MRRIVASAMMVAVLAGTPTVGMAAAPKKVAAPPIASSVHLPARNVATKKRPVSKGLAPPNAEDAALMRPEYLAELAKVHEPPEMARKPMQAPKPPSSEILKLGKILDQLGSPEKATHQQRQTAIHDFLEIARAGKLDEAGRAMIYALIPALACLDGANPQTVIGYASEATGKGSPLALRARMYLEAGDRDRSLEDLEKVLADGDTSALSDGKTDPSKDSVPCGWSLADFDKLGSDPRALAAKGLYLSAFIPYGARGTVKEAEILDLYARSARSWHSPIPYALQAALPFLGSEKSMAAAKCIRGINPSLRSDTDAACKAYDEAILRELRALTMALVMDPRFTLARSARAEKYLNLAQSAYADGKPSRDLFELAIKDFTTALADKSENQHTIYADRALALASLGKYKDAASDYIQAIKRADGGTEISIFLYEQLANIHIKMGEFNEASDVLTQAISNAYMENIVLLGGIKAFRALYAEYDSLPDEILAEVVRRRVEPYFDPSWDANFIAGQGLSKGKLNSTILPELYVMRGDAYMKAGRRVAALEDYRRVKSDVWDDDEATLPRHQYFNAQGARSFELPEPWPASPPKF